MAVLDYYTMSISTLETCIWSFLHSILDADILIMTQKVRLMMFSMNMVDFPKSFLLLSTWGTGTIVCLSAV